MLMKGKKKKVVLGNKDVKVEFSVGELLNLKRMRKNYIVFEHVVNLNDVKIKQELALNAL